jgi:hypothetical protein
MTRRRNSRQGSPKAEPGEKTTEPLEEGPRTNIRFLLRGDMDTNPEILARLDRFDFNHEEIDYESMGVLFGMKDDMQLWNAIVIVAHAKVIAGEQSFGKELEHELVGAITGLRPENLSDSMIRKLGLIARMSPNDIARAAARRKLEEIE